MNYYNYYNHFMAPWTASRTTWVSWYQKGKTNLDLLGQKTVSGSGISWAICKSAFRHRQITMPASHHSVFTGRMPFLLPNKHHQSTEGMNKWIKIKMSGEAKIRSTAEKSSWPIVALCSGSNVSSVNLSNKLQHNTHTQLIIINTLA